jgi:hypothetical protein
MKRWLQKFYKRKDIHQTPDGSWDVDGDVRLFGLGLTKLPLKFNKVNGNFSCSFNNLTTLEGTPKSVGRSFYCYNNNLTNLKGSPKSVGGDFDCSNNNLISLKEIFYLDFNKVYLDDDQKKLKDYILWKRLNQI